MSNARYEIINNKDGTGYYVKKQDAGKPRLDLVPLEIIEAIGDVMTEALKVYEEESWRTVEPKRYIAAFTRHWIKYRMVGDSDVSIEDKRFNKLFKDIKDYSKIKVRALEPRIRQLAYEESQEWPKNNNMISRDEEYKDIMRELEIEVKDFAEKNYSWNYPYYAERITKIIFEQRVYK